MNTREVGTVLWYNSSKGFGYIQRDQDKKHFFVHFKNIHGSDKGYCSLSEGDKVTFFIKQTLLHVPYGKDREVADDVVVFDSAEEVEAREARLAVLLGLFKPAGAWSQLQQSFSKDYIFEQKLIPIVFEFAGISPKK